MIDFPLSPAVDDTVTAPDGKVWRWNGSVWVFEILPGDGSSTIEVGTEVGVISSFSGDVIPPDSLLCNGQAVPAGVEYDKLRSIVGANVPDLRDKFLLGASASKAIRTTGGAETHTLSVAEMPSHGHGVSGPAAHSLGVIYSGGPHWVTFGFREATVNSGGHFGTIAADPNGGGGTHNNMPPWYAVVFIIQAKPTMRTVAAPTVTAEGGGGSGFTFVQDTAPTAAKEGDTWFNTATGAGGGRSCVAVDEGSGELVWVQFAPGSGALPVPRAVVQAPLQAGYSIGASFAHIPIGAASVHQPAGYYNVTAGGIGVLNPGIYRVYFEYAFNSPAGAALTHYIHGYLEHMDPSGTVVIAASEHLLGAANPYGYFYADMICNVGVVNEYVRVRSSIQANGAGTVRGGYIGLERIA